VPVLSDRAKRLGTGLGIIGVLIILVSAWVIKPTTPWPGSAAIVPVFATGLVILGGTLRESSGFGVVTNFLPVQWVGNISYSLYLVHWPVLVIAMEYSVNGTLPRRTEVELVALSVAIAAAIYYALENPIRRSKLLRGNGYLTYAMGACLIAASYAAIYWHLHHFAT
jgi:peptidoglycan/LPS O-acetylase OafA/YrhL